MNRRKFLARGAVGAVTAAAAAQAVAQAPALPNVRWRCASSFPKSLDTIYGGAEVVAKRVEQITGGKFQIRAFAAGEIVPAFGVVDALQQGTIECSHTASYYFVGKNKAFAFDTTLPFGMNQREQNAWIYYGGGQDLVREFFKDFGFISFPAGNTGAQMGGWWRKPVTKVADLKGVKMRIAGLGGEVMARLGVTTVNLPGAELFTALQSGAIDATEWVGPYNDLAFGLHRVSKYCYYPGWQEPGPTLECMIHKPAFDALPEDLKAVVENCCRAVNDSMLAEYTARNQRALVTLRDEHQVDFRPLPPDVLAALKQASREVLEEAAAKDPFTRKVYDSMRAFQDGAQAWHALSEKAWYAARD